jgi:hypothetical protein
MNKLTQVLTAITSALVLIPSDLVGLPRTLQLRVNYSTGGIYDKETEIQQGI